MRRARIVAWLGMALSVQLCLATTEEFSYPFQGITVIHRTQTSPRPLDMHIAIIDLLAPGVSFEVTPPAPPGSPGEVISKTPRTLLTQVGAQLAVNGDFSQFVTTLDGVTYRNPQSVAASLGTPYSRFSTYEPAFNVARNNVATMITSDGQPPHDYATNPSVPLWNAWGGSDKLVSNGVNAAPSNSLGNALNPRTATAVTFDNKLILFTCDGRQSGYSEGLYFSEMADILIEYNAKNAINNDGGGSTQFVLANPTPTVLNRPSDGSERPTGDNVAVFARPMPPPIPAGAATKVLQAGVNGYDPSALSLRSLQPDTKTGNNAVIKAGYDTDQGKARTIFSFPLSGIPADATIASVSLALDNFDVARQSGQYVDMELYQLTGDFDETTATWNSRRSGVPWDTPGGDFEGIPLSTLYQVNNTGMDFFVDTIAFAEAAQDALDAGEPLNLMLIAPDAETVTNNLYARFRSDDATTGTLPALTVIYTVPEPGAFGLTVLLAVVLRFRLR